MKTRDVIQHYGSPEKTAAALRCSRQAVYQWGDEPPELRQYQIEVLTRGKLRARPFNQAA